MITEDFAKITAKGSNYKIGELVREYPGLRHLQTTEQVGWFDGVDAVLDYAATLKAKGYEKASERKGEPGFNTFGTFEEAVKVFREQPESITKFDQAELRVTDNEEAGKNVDYDVVGDFIDMGRFMEGIPESVGTMHNGNARNRRINMVFAMNYPGHSDESAINHRSVRMLRLIDALEAGGVRVMLTGITSNQCDHVEVVVKRHEEPLTLTDIAVVTHSDFLRRILFRIREQSKTLQWGYGGSMMLTDSITPEMMERDASNDELSVFIGNDFDHEHTIDDSFDKLERLLVWELSKPVPEVGSIKMTERTIDFNPNGARASDDIRREGNEAMEGDE